MVSRSRVNRLSLHSQGTEDSRRGTWPLTTATRRESGRVLPFGHAHGAAASANAGCLVIAGFRHIGDQSRRPRSRPNGVAYLCAQELTTFERIAAHDG